MDEMSRETRAEAGGLIDNPELFRGVLVLDGLPGRRRGRFSLITPCRREDDEIREAPIRFGLESESARLNLSVLLRWEEELPGSATQALMNLPGMTVQIADAVLDWLDEDNQPRPFGAEAEFYASLEPPYAPRNGTPERIEELLLVRGVTRQLLFGQERSRTS